MGRPMAKTVYQPVIGLEIHFQLKTKSKMFCSCANQEVGEPNTFICPICSGQPGTLSVANRQAVEWVVLIGLAVGGEMQPSFRFERKNYFYPDLPKGYQITSANYPPTVGGSITVGDKPIRIHHVHLEEDTGKLTHSADGQYSLVDLNRAGAPLVELVSEADFVNGWEAKTFCHELQLILRTLQVSDADMEKGQMRCEVNVSLRPEGQEAYGTKVEIKNINSFRAVEKAIDYEIARQTALLEKGEAVAAETRGWDEDKHQTVGQRLKEEAGDYRYFPEPDLPAIALDQDLYERLSGQLPELPAKKRQRFIDEYGFSLDDARLLTVDGPTADYVEQVISELRAWLVSLEGVSGSADDIWQNNKKKLIKLVGGWLTTGLFGLLKEKGQVMTNVTITPENFAEFITLIYQNKINSTAGQVILKEMLATGGDPSDIMSTKDLGQVEDEGQLTTIINQVIRDNPDIVGQYKKGKKTVIQFLVGQAMKISKGKASPTAIHSLLATALDDDSQSDKIPADD